MKQTPPSSTDSVDIPFDRFLSYTELTDTLHRLASPHPGLLTVESLAQTLEGREIWLCTVTNAETGPHHEKPALWVDANIHATEHLGCTAALYLLDRVLTGYGEDERITRALDTRCLYVVPRISPDGAEASLADNARHVRSSLRAWPHTDQQDGLIVEDVDGDGRILMMRVLDDNGAWKPYDDDPRLLVARDPTEDGPGPYYRLLTEGRIQNFDGVTVKAAPPLAGLDINRNYPAAWQPATPLNAAGPFPTSEPEIRAVVQALVDRPNVCGFIQYHTYSGVHLRPPCTAPDESLPTWDLRVYDELAAQATEITGYPVVSVYHGFRYNPKEVITGVSLDWAYDHLGVFSWVTEFWNPVAAAGVEVETTVIDWTRKHSLDDELKLLAYADEQGPGVGYVDWYRVAHPELGEVELGGWNVHHWWRNPPPNQREKEVSRHVDWALHNLLISPRLTLRDTHVEQVGDGAWQVRMVVQNAGWLPTNVTERALERKAVRPVEMELVVPEQSAGVEVIGERRLEVGQLTGRALKRSSLLTMDGTPDRAVGQWLLRGPAGAKIELVARHARAGVVRTTLELR